MLPLQFSVEQTEIDYLLLFAVTLVAMGLSLYIVFVAFRGYRRNNSRRMLLLAVGFTLLTIAPLALSLVGTSIDRLFGVGQRLYTFYLPIGGRLLELCGLGCILYSLFMRQDL